MALGGSVSDDDEEDEDEEEAAEGSVIGSRRRFFPVTNSFAATDELESLLVSIGVAIARDDDEYVETRAAAASGELACMVTSNADDEADDEPSCAAGDRSKRIERVAIPFDGD